jgi:hypothetical protein
VKTLKLGLLLLVMPGCLTIQESKRIVETPVRTERETSVVPGSARYDVSGRARGADLEVLAAREELCSSRDVQVLHQVELTERTAESYAPTGWLLGLGLPLGTLGGLALAAGAPATGYDDEGRTALSPATWAVLAGSTMAVAAILDLLRTRNSEEDRGEVKRAGPSSQSACRKRVPTDAVFQFSSGRTQPLRFDARGVARASMVEAAAPEVPGPRTPAGLRWEEQVHAVDVPQAESEHLVAALRGLPGSRVARDIRERAERACLSLVERARAQGTTSEPALAAWDSARAGCGETWTAAYATEHKQVEAAVAQAQRVRLAQQCEAGLAQAEGQLRTQPSAAATSVEEVRKSCTLAGVARFADVERAVAAEVERLRQEAERVRAEMERRAAEQQALQALQQDRTAFLAALRGGRLEDAHATVAGNALLQANLQKAAEVEALLVGQLEAAGQRATRAEGAESPEALCAARRLYVALFGEVKWVAQLTRSTKNLGRSDARAGSSFFNLAEACGR